MNDASIFLPLAAGIVSALASAVVLLYRDLSKCRADLADAIEARVASAERNTEWALKLQEAQHAQIDKLVGITAVLERRRP